MSNKRILVPGGAGYIGAHTVAALVESGAQVVVVDDLETGFEKAIDPAAKFYQGDIRDKAFLDDVFEKEPIDAVIHFAAYSQVGESMENPLKYYDNNLNGTRVLLSSMIEHDVKKIVFSSTAATYGEPRNIPILESDPTEPTNAYGATKLAMEGMMRWCARAYGLKFVSLRYFNACGAHSRGHIGEAHNPESHLIPPYTKNKVAKANRANPTPTQTARAILFSNIPPSLKKAPLRKTQIPIPPNVIPATINKTNLRTRTFQLSSSTGKKYRSCTIPAAVKTSAASVKPANITMAKRI